MKLQQNTKEWKEAKLLLDLRVTPSPPTADIITIQIGDIVWEIEINRRILKNGRVLTFANPECIEVWEKAVELLLKNIEDETSDFIELVKQTIYGVQKK